MNQSLLARYGLKWNPFSQELPTEALRLTRPAEDFLWRIEHNLVREGGFALIQGDPGTGKSVVMRLLAERLERLADRFDSRPLLSIVLAGDARLAEKLKRDELLPLGSRVRTRLAMEYATRDDLMACL